MTLQQPEERDCLLDARELDAKGLHFNEAVLQVHNAVADERLKKDTNEAHQARLHILILDGFARRDAVGDVLLNEERW